MPDPISWPDLIRAAWPLWFALGVTLIVGTAGHWNVLLDKLEARLTRRRMPYVFQCSECTIRAQGTSWSEVLEFGDRHERLAHPEKGVK